MDRPPLRWVIRSNRSKIKTKGGSDMKDKYAIMLTLNRRLNRKQFNAWYQSIRLSKGIIA